MNDEKIKQYKVIEFLDKHLVSVIPSNWVLEDGSCVWPLNLKNTRTLIIKRQKPADNWGQYQRSSFIDHGSFDSYENALQHEKIIVKSSESEDNIPSRYGRKIKTKKVTDYEEYLQPPSPTLSTASFSSVCRDVSNTRKCASEVQTAKIPVCSQQSVGLLSAIHDHFVSKNNPPTPTLVEKEMPVCSNQLVTVPCSINYSLVSSNNPSTPPSVEENEDLITIDDIPVVTPCEHEPIMNLLQEIKTLCQITVAKVNAFENSRFNNVTPISESVDKVTAFLPLKSIDELLTFEEMIQTDPDVKSQLRAKLSFVGGSDFKNLIRRCLPKLLTDDLAQQCSWTGQKNNFQVGNLCLMKIFAEAVSENFPLSKQRQFELVVMEWLRFATQRLKRNNE